MPSSDQLTTTYKAQQNAEAARIAAAIALYYQVKVDPANPQSVERWLALVVPHLIAASDSSAHRAASYYQAVRLADLRRDDGFRPVPTLGSVDPGVRSSLLMVGPYDYMNKAHQVSLLQVSPQQQRALLAQAKQDTVAKVAAAAVRHAQAGGRNTIIDNTERDKVALGWIRVTKAKPCYFCAMLASRGITYRSYGEHSFDASDPRFVGSGTAKVHDSCGCSMKAVYTEKDPVLSKNLKFADQWSMWGAGGGDAALRFRRGYEHYQKTGETLTWDQANAGLRGA